MTAITAETRVEIERLERKHAEHPEGRYFVPLANAYRKAGEVDRAIRVLRQGLAKHPEYVSAHIVLGRCFRDEGNLDAAGAEFQHVLSLDPQNLVALRMLGELAAADGNVSEARRWYGELLAVDPMNEEAHQALEELGPGEAEAVAEYVEGATDGAAGELEQTDALAAGATGVDPAGQARPLPGDEPRGFGGSQPEFPVYGGGESVVTETIAELYTRQGFYDRAIEVYNELLRRRGEDPRLRERIERVQRLAAGEAEELPATGKKAPAPAAAAPSAPAGPPDPFADSFLEGFPGDGRTTDGRAARAGDGRGAPALAGADEPPTIRSFLQDVLGWTPPGPSEGGAPEHMADPFAAAGTPGPGVTPAGSEAPTGAGSDADMPWLETPEEHLPEAAIQEPQPTTDVPWLDPLEETSPEVGIQPDETVYDMAAVPVETPAEPEMPSFADATSIEMPEPTTAQTGDVAGWVPDAGSDVEAPASAPAMERTVEAPPPEEPPYVSPIAGIPEDELFPWEIPLDEEDGSRSAAPPAAESAPPAQPQVSFDEELPAPGMTAAPDVPPRAAAPDAAPFDEPPVRPADEPGSAAEPRSDDDDLESFQAWLRSLKR